MEVPIGERMAKIEEKVDGLKETQDKLVDRLDAFILASEKRHEDFIEKADEKYARKEVEKWIIGTVAAVGVIIISAILKLVFKI